MYGRESARTREREKGEEIQKGGTEWRGRERHIVRRFRNKRELLPVIQHRQTQLIFLLQLPCTAAVPGCFKQAEVEVQATEKGSCLLAEVRQAGRQAKGKPVDVFKTLLI